MKFRKFFYFISIFSSLLLFLSELAVAQETYPSRLINIVVPAPPGGSTDLGVRILANQLSEELAGTVIVLNKPGGGALVGTEFVRQSKPDGYTILGVYIAFVTLPILDPKCPYTIDNFDPISLNDIASNVVVVKNDGPFKNLKEVIEFAKKNPGRLSYGSSGIGSTSHFFGETFKQSIGLEISHVPFKGDAPILAAVVGGHVDLGFPTLPGAFSLIKGRKVRGLCVGSKERSPDFPDLPTIGELGYSDVGVDVWHGFIGPKGIPKAVVEKLSAAIEKSLKNSSVQSGLRKIGLSPAYMNPGEFKRFMEKETEKFKRVAQKADMIIKY